MSGNPAELLVVIDTNVLISSLLSTGTAPSMVREAWTSGRYHLVLSSRLLDEYRDVLERPHIQKKVDARALHAFLDQLRLSAFFFELPSILPKVVADDPDDDVIVATALAGRADIIVSGDRHLLELKTHRGIDILTPRQFWERLESPHAR